MVRTTLSFLALFKKLSCMFCAGFSIPSPKKTHYRQVKQLLRTVLCNCTTIHRKGIGLGWSLGVRHKSGRRRDSSAKRLESERRCTQGRGALVGQLGKLRPIGNRPDPEGTPAFAPDSGGSQPPRRLPACPTSRQRFHSYVVHPMT